MQSKEEMQELKLEFKRVPWLMKRTYSEPIYRDAGCDLLQQSVATLMLEIKKIPDFKETAGSDPSQKELRTNDIRPEDKDFGFDQWAKRAISPKQSR